MNTMFRLGVVFLALLVSIGCGTGSGGDKAGEKPLVGGNIFHDPVFRHIYTLQNQRDFRGVSVFLKDKEARYRKAAAIACASLQTPEAVMPLAALLEDENLEVRGAAAYSLGQTGDKQAEPLLIASLLKQSSPAVKKDILEAIGKCGSEKGLEFITGLTVEMEPPEVLIGRVWGIYRFGLRNIVSPGGTTLAVACLDPGMPDQARFIAANYLARGNNIVINSYAEEIIAACREEKNLFTRLSLVASLGKIQKPEVVVFLTGILQGDALTDYRLKVNALRALGRHGLPESKELFLKLTGHENRAIAVAASEYFLNNGTAGDGWDYFQTAQQLQHWRSRANMLAAALIFTPGEAEKKVISERIFAAFKTSQDNYEKAFLLKALAGDVRNYRFLASQVFDNMGKNPVIATYGIDGLVEMCRGAKGDKNMQVEFAGTFKRAIETGDPALLLYASGILRDPDMNFKALYDNIDFLTAALGKCKLPDDLEGYQALRLTVDYFLGSKEGKEGTAGTAGAAGAAGSGSSPVPTIENHPIDWDVVTSLKEGQRVRIGTTRGDIVLRLLVNESPGSVSNFVQLIRGNFYKGNAFHRVVPNFVIQVGCPRGDGVGGPPYTIGSELSPIYYDEGSVGMASAGKDTEGSQWFITHSPTPHLDGRYTIFARVDTGMDVVHLIEIGDRILNIELLPE